MKLILSLLSIFSSIASVHGADAGASSLHHEKCLGACNAVWKENTNLCPIDLAGRGCRKLALGARASCFIECNRSSRRKLEETGQEEMDSTGNPTASPSANPTDSSSPSISLSPSVYPTDSPTTSPTLSPTISAIQPTTSPTANPTAAPTTLPTLSPTDHTTANPTSAPSASPTSGPSFSPTANPSPSPTGSPTVSPTSSPTSKPSVSPTSLEQCYSTCDENFQSELADCKELAPMQRSTCISTAIANRETCKRDCN